MTGLFKGKKLVMFFLFMVSPLFSQNWNDIKQITIPFTLYSELDLFTNIKGNNILINYKNGLNNYLKYYLISTSGSIIRSSSPFENQEVEFASIDGNNDKVYVVYKLNNIIKTKKSTNGGISWTNISEIDIGNNLCNNVDIIWGKDDNALHIVWATRDAEFDYKTYYRRLYNDQWGSREYVTEGSSVGGFPTISKSNNRVHVSYNTGQEQYPIGNLGDAYSRDKYYNNWQTPELVFSNTSLREKIHAGNAKLFDFYYQDMYLYCNLLVKERNFNNTYWSSSLILDYTADPEQIISATNTSNSKTHVVYIIGGGVGYRYYDGSWSEESSILSTYFSPKISSYSNDLYVISGATDYINYRQYDDLPLPPQNVQVNRDANNHPYLTWSANTEPDLQKYIIQKDNGQGWQNLSETTNLYYEDATETYCTAIPPAECEDEYTVYYHIRAVDINSHQSDPSNDVRAYVTGGHPEKGVSDNLQISYKLDQNFPNPFNPITSISYSLEKDGFVTLKVYDMLGREVAELVNGNQYVGNYAVEFNAINLPSGIYIYQLQSGGFTDMKKMLLIK